MGGWLGAGVLIVGAALMLWNAVPALWHPGTPQAKGMLLLAVLGIAFNGFAASRLHAGHSLQSAPCISTCWRMCSAGWQCSLARWCSWPPAGHGSILRSASASASSSCTMPCERCGAAPTSLCKRCLRTSTRKKVRERLLKIPNITDVHDQHAWTLDGNYTVLTLHIAANGSNDADMLRVKQETRAALYDMGVNHATIELELPGEECAVKQ
ncbi:MAG: cation transporter [Flavobacteriales bacterium]|nr:cation transporter [Flavobacteriales bacterium]